MTRQKKELLKKIEEIDISIQIDIQLGFGYDPPGAHDSMYDKMDRLRKELAHLRHYESAQEMYMDERGKTLDLDLPW